jgi:D-arginine dehydrogenase
MTEVFDIVVIGAGMAGASISAHLSSGARVCLLEMEDQPGYHSTGRSAAVFSENYGNATIRALTRASRPFFDVPPEGFTDAPLLQPRQVLQIAANAEELEACLGPIPSDERDILSADAALALVPILKPEALAAAILQRRPADIEVHALHHGYLRRFKANGGVLRSTWGAREVLRAGDVWSVRTAAGTCHAPIVVNAAGAWAGQVAAMAGAVDIGLQPLKRTACLIDPPAAFDTARWPMLKDARDRFYLKPDAGKLLLSPCDETLTEPGDAQADEIDVAIAVDRVEQATTLQVRRVSHRWAGLRSFVADRSPVVGYDPVQPGFFWLAALGGYGIQTAPALSRLAASLLRQAPPDPDLEAMDINPQSLSPARFARVPA